MAQIRMTTAKTIVAVLCAVGTLGVGATAASAATPAVHGGWSATTSVRFRVHPNNGNWR